MYQYAISTTPTAAIPVTTLLHHAPQVFSRGALFAKFKKTHIHCPGCAAYHHARGYRKRIYTLPNAASYCSWVKTKPHPAGHPWITGLSTIFLTRDVILSLDYYCSIPMAFFFFVIIVAVTSIMPTSLPPTLLDYDVAYLVRYPSKSPLSYRAQSPLLLYYHLLSY